MILRDVVIRPVLVDEEARFQALMQAHHYLGALPKFGQTLWYVAVDGGEWLALLVFSAAALKVGARDAWIGWDFRCQYARLHLIANNSRFLILPGHRHPHLASRVLGLAARRVRRDWPLRFGHPLWLLETFVDPSRFAGTCYRAANWLAVGMSRGYRRTRNGFSATSTQPKRVFVLPLIAHAARRLSQAQLPLSLCPGGPKRMVSAHTMQSLPDFFADIQDPRRRQGRRHPLPAVLSIAAAATLCGARGYKAMAQWAQSLGQQALARFRCRYEQRRYHVPSESIIRNVLIRVDPAELDAALQRWNAQFARADTALAIDGKTLCNAIDADGRRTHVLSLVGHDSGVAVAQKKSAPCPPATMAP